MANEAGTATEAWEYLTYAPAGSRCSTCGELIKTLEPVRRGAMEVQSGPPVVIYRHAAKCPEATR
ncbi:hypothetical protein AB0I49_27310 [Streptomyces sp. NPDC050617]|uniref:hypothetical protein n=1 Tax=Streptomyces sp. NPDC050617 TaxID=3154628 RepID=UPI003424A175